MDNPYLLIVCGPTASGKGSLPNKAINYLNLDENYENILIDNLVENNPYFKENINKIILNYKEKGYTDENIINLFLNPTDELLSELSEVYFISRDYTNCFTGEIKDSNTCSIINDNYLEDSFNKGLNIVFETTGTYFPEWIFRIFIEQITKYNYNIIFSWSVVDICKLLNRNIKRIQKDIIEFLKDINNKPPRLPDIRLKSYTNNLKKIINTFIYTNKFKNDLVCRITNYPNCNIRLLIFDNNSMISNILYDSDINNINEGNVNIQQYNLNHVNECNEITKKITVNKQFGSKKKYNNKKIKKSYKIYRI